MRQLVCYDLRHSLQLCNRVSTRLQQQSVKPVRTRHRKQEKWTRDNWKKNMR